MIDTSGGQKANEIEENDMKESGGGNPCDNGKADRTTKLLRREIVKQNNETRETGYEDRRVMTKTPS